MTSFSCFLFILDANVAVIGTHAAQSAAKLAVEGNYAEARINALVTQKLVERHV